MTKKTEGLPDSDVMNASEREKEKGKERGREGEMHTSRFPRAARCKRRASRAHLYVSAKGNGISQGLSGTLEGGGAGGSAGVGKRRRGMIAGSAA